MAGKVESFLSDNCPPMGIYETLYAFRDSFGQFMGTEGTHPWSQGFPLTTPLEKFGGPSLPSSVDVTPEDHSLFFAFEQFGKGENLESSAVGKNRSIPIHELV